MKYDNRYYVNAIIVIDCLVLHYLCIAACTKFLLLQMAGQHLAFFNMLSDKKENFTKPSLKAGIEKKFICVP